MRHDMRDFEMVIYVNRFGTALLRCPWADDLALQRVKDAAAVPPECGPMIMAAPARGTFQTFIPREVVRTDAGNFVSRHAGYKRRLAVRVSDVFEQMTAASLKAWRRECKRAEAKGLQPPAFVPPFTYGQMQVGQDYAALSERCAASGCKCSSLETQSGGGAGGGREEAVIADLQRLRAYHRRIGNGLAKEVRRLRPSAHGGVKRREIRVRVLVDAICLDGETLSDVLKAHGWAKNKVVYVALHSALCAALDRMQGY